MQFTEQMTGWGRAAVVVWWILMPLSMLLSIADLDGSAHATGYFLGQIVSVLIIPLFVYSKYKENKVTQGTLFVFVLNPILGIIAHLINENPSKSNVKDDN